MEKEKCTICGITMENGATMVFKKDRETRCHTHENTIPVESETTNYLYSEVIKLEKRIKDLRQIVIEDVPHQYQKRLLELLP